MVLDCREEDVENCLSVLTDISPVDFSFEKTFDLGGKGLIHFLLQERIVFQNNRGRLSCLVQDTPVLTEIGNSQVAR